VSQSTLSIRRLPFFLAVLLQAALILSACAPQPAQGAHVQQVQATPTNPPAALETQPAAKPAATATLAPTTAATTLWISPDLPSVFTASLSLPSDLILAETAAAADLRVEMGGESVLSTWTYALAAPFATYTDDVSASSLQALWGQGKPVGAEGKSLLVDPSTAAVFTSLWGEPAVLVKVLPAEDLLSEAWRTGTAWALVPFENLEPRWKVLSIDGQSPLRKDFDPTSYPLIAHFTLAGDPDLAGEIMAAYGPRSAAPLLAAANRDAGRLTTVLLTGVTALVRGTAVMMEYNGMTYPAQDIRAILRQADILHINNEVPFSKNCPPPYPWEGLVFCSQERYIELMDDIGTDVVELAGDHFADWGSDAMLFTLDLYRQRGWPIYGGGANIEEAKKPAYFELNGNKIAFIGCNYKAIGYATASKTNPGAVHCDPAWLFPAVRAAKEQGYLPIVTFQHEEYYEYIARPKLQQDFRAVAQAGAVIVSGSQAHQPHAFEFTSQSFLHYGLGNLFFDQISTDEATGWAFLDRHVFYGGKYIGTEMISIVFVDMARSRLATPEERRAMLEKVYQAGGYK
jgi:poly-gamma-glutamate synthesis protein (capsule biosynthesis protein)